MSRSALRTMLAGLDDAALEALASRGLLRRAAADAEAGKVRIEEENEKSAKLVVDGETVQLSATGAAAGSCTCPAPGICRHRLAAMVYLRRSEAAPAEVEAVDWVSVFSAITPADLARFAGRAAWREVRARHEARDDHEKRAVEIAPQGKTLLVRLSASQPPVTFLAGGGLKAAISKAPVRARKGHIVAAALAARDALGLPPPAVEPAADADSVVAPVAQARSLEDVQNFLERAYATALAVSPVALEEEARRLSVAGRVEALPRLAAMLRRLAAALSAQRARDADADPDQLLAMIAETYGLCVALGASNEVLRSKLAGQTRQDYADVGGLDLVGLGARLWEAPSGAHGVTTHFFAPGSGQNFSLTLARGDRADPQFQPTTAFHHTPIWGAPMARLCAARVRLPHAQASAAGRLSTSAAARARLEPWTPKRDGVRPWACAFDDWTALEKRLRLVFTPRLTDATALDTAVVLLFSRHAPARFDELTQTLLWPLADTAGRWIALMLPYEGVERERIATLEQCIGTERAWAVLAVAAADAGRIELRPYALWGAGQRLLDFSPAPRHKGSRIDLLLARLRRVASRSASAPQVLAAGASASDGLLGRAWGTLLRRAELGEGGLRESFVVEAGELAGKLMAAGFASLAPHFRRLNQTSEATAANCLRAAYAVLTMRLARARLAWMR
jgi:hypothetical protein